MADPIDYSGLLSDWEQRLKNYQGFGPTFENITTDTPEYARLNRATSNLQNSWDTSDSQDLRGKAQEFKDAFIANKEALQQKTTSWGTPPKPVGDLLQEFYQAAPGARQGTYFSPDQSRHEIYSHLYPYKEGIAPDYRSFQGFTKSFPATPITPLNEGLAVPTDVAMERGLDVFTKVDPKGLAASLQRFVPQVSQSDVPADRPEGYDVWNKLFGTGHTEEDLSRIKNIGQMYKEKYVAPATQRFTNLTNLQVPSTIEGGTDPRLGTTIGAYSKQQKLDQLLDLVNDNLRGIAEEQGQTAPPDFFEKDFLKKNLLYSRDPVTSAVQGASEMVRQNPRGVAAGAGLSLLNPEVTKALARGDVGSAAGTVGKDVAFGAGTEAGVRLAGAGLQRVAPTVAGVVNPAVAGLAAFAAPALATYGGITGGNEAVRAFTGESVPSKVRQFLGTQGRTGRTSPDWERNIRPNYTIPTVQQMTPQQRVVHQNLQNQNEFQRRLQLAGQRFNPAKGEFGLSEMLFGR